MWQVFLALLFLFLFCAADVSVGMGWMSSGAGGAQGVLDGVVGLLQKYVVNQPLPLLLTAAFLFCMAHTLFMSFMPSWLMHFLRHDWVADVFVAKGWVKGLDRLRVKIRRRPVISWLIDAAVTLSRIATLPIEAAMRVALDPASSRVVIAAVFLPVAVAGAAWAVLDKAPGLVPEVLPAGFAETDGTGRDKQKLVWVSLGLVAAVGGGFEVARLWVAPGLARWFVGEAVHPAAFQWGLGAGVLGALVLAGVHLDGNVFAGPLCDVPDGRAACGNGERPGRPLVATEAPATADGAVADQLMAQSLRTAAPEAQRPPAPPAPLDPASVHMCALFAACAAVAAVHIGLPVFNRREYAVLRMGG